VPRDADVDAVHLWLPEIESRNSINIPPLRGLDMCNT
jgi:hypothetical protein